jgi:glycosyltransferase involved in cell wall biosynthesis
MRISFGLPEGVGQEQVWAGNGYGYATRMLMNSLTRLGYEWSENDKSADVEFWFDQPVHWRPSSDKYVIGYHPWESTLLPPEWRDMMNSCDEIWTPSPVIADWYHRYAGITKPVYVFEHGVGPIWTPYERKAEGTFKYLHIGGEAIRKGMKEILAAHRHLYGHDNTAELNLKMTSEGWRVSGWPNVNIVPDSLELPELVQLYHDNHVFVYPSWGEGFGLTPLQAMATGMPTITLSSWAPYARFLDPNLVVESELSDPPEEHILYNRWRQIHPGQMWKPDQKSLESAMTYARENYDACVAYAMAQTDEIRAHYDWDRLTEEAFKNLESRL